MSDDTDDHADRGLPRPGRRPHLAGQRARPLPRRAAAPDGDLRRQRARRPPPASPTRSTTRPASPPASPPAASRWRRPTTPSACSTLMGDFGADEGRYAIHHPWADRLPRDADARPGPARRRHAPRRLPLPDRGLDRRRRDERPAGPRRRRDARRDGARLLRPARRRRSATSPRASGATPSSASPASPRSPPPRTAAPRRRPPSPTGSPRVADSFGTAQLRPVRDAQALRPPPPPERGAARRLDRLGPRDARAPRPRLRRPPMTVDVTTRPRTLESYVAGQWVRGTGKGQTLLNAATGAPVARIDSSGIDFAAALAYGRDTVGPKLRKLSFHERAAMLKALGQYLMAHKEEFYAESLATGATRADGWIDIEGGVGTLLSYASKARRELPNTRVLTDGDVEVALQGLHLLRPAHPDAARRRRHPHQRLQLPGLGHAGEGRPHLHRRRPLHREAGEPDRLPDRARRPPHRRVAASSPRAPSSSSPARSATCSTTSPARTSSPSPAPPGPAASCARTRRSSRTPSASPWRPTASTPRSSAPTPPPARRSSTSSSRRSPAR